MAPGIWQPRPFFRLFCYFFIFFIFFYSPPPHRVEALPGMGSSGRAETTPAPSSVRFSPPRLHSQNQRPSLLQTILPNCQNLAGACGCLPSLCFAAPFLERCCCGDLGLQVSWRENFVRHRHPAQQCSLWRLGFDIELTSREIPSSVNRKDTGGVCICL